MSTWIYTLGAVGIVSLISLVGVFTLSVRPEKLRKFLLFLVSFAAGTLLGDAFFHLIPESLSEESTAAPFYILLGLVIFFVLEKFIHWRHCHETPSDDHPHAFSYLILVGDFFHNFVDGMIIAASFLVSVPLGIATTIAVILHEIPQEIGDFGSLVYGGFSVGKALILNFLSGLSAIVGALVVLVLSINVENIASILVPFSAGGLIYIASSDMIPELHKTTNIRQSALQLLFILMGIGIMAGLLFLE